MQSQWKPQPEAESLVRGLVDDFLGRTPGAARFAERMRTQTGTRFRDWIDTIAIPLRPENAERLDAAGFVRAGTSGGVWMETWSHGGAILPRIAEWGPDSPLRVYLHVDSVADAASLWVESPELLVLGRPGSPLRFARLAGGDGTELWAVERHGERGYSVDESSDTTMLLEVLEWFRLRRRAFAQDEDGFAEARAIIDRAIAKVGRDTACSLFFRAERLYWASRNRAARIQKARQDALGLGWGNHDHHTFRSSRPNLRSLLGVFRQLGFQPRERFHAGREAGWGAQVLEQPAARIVIFADVDLSPDELAIDFYEDTLPERDTVGTVGLWCALHGDSFLTAGMHHLECQFDFDELRDQLHAEEIDTMAPFTDNEWLRQAFTVGERWPVAETRLAALVAKGLITPADAARFGAEGAIGSHLENLERNGGFKGFNQHGVSHIISATDPRRQIGGHAG